MKITGTTLLLLLHLICHAQAETADQVAVKGLITHPFIIDLQSIERMQPEVHNNVNIVCSSGETKKELRSFKGISLKRILDNAGIVMPKPKERGKYYIAVRATDGYTTLYAWNEIYNNPTGNHVFLIYEENGQPIREDGRFVMICSNDLVTGPRHVKWVQSITVEKLP
jgi:DMSO/TMAO reductase YedYZ molybdopterin-dependent catalytic subunit